MNITNKTVRTFNIYDVTEKQAQDLLNIAVNCPPDVVQQGVITADQRETLNNLRQALLAAGLKKGDANAN